MKTRVTAESIGKHFNGSLRKRFVFPKGDAMILKLALDGALYLVVALLVGSIIGGFLKAGDR